MVIHTMICDSGLFSPLSPSFHLLFLYPYPIFLSSLSPISSPPLRSLPQMLHHICRGETKHFPDDIQLAGCPVLSSLSHSILVSPRQGLRKKSIFIRPQLLSFFSLHLPVRKHPAPITQDPLLYFIHSSFLSDCMWLSVLLSVFHRHDPHFKMGWHVVECDMQTHQSELSSEGNTAGACYNCWFSSINCVDPIIKL